MSAVSSLTKKFDFLQDRAQRRPIREGTPLDVTGGDGKKTSISHLKDFYLKRLAKSEPSAAARLGGAQPSLEATQPQASAASGGQTRPSFAPGTVPAQDLEIMCNNCFCLILASEAHLHGDPAGCPTVGSRGPNQKPAGMIGLLDLKLKNLRAALEVRLTDASSKVNVMRHLTQLRYHVDTAIKWTPGCSELGVLSDHTVQQVKQLTSTSRVLAPAVYILSKRIENVVAQKERELRKAMVGTSLPERGPVDVDVNHHDDAASSIADLKSVVSEMDSNCGTEYAETMVTQDGPVTDVGNVQDANDYLSLKNEDEQRRWFYSQCLTVKLCCSDKSRARKTLISDLYAKVRAEGVPIEGWVQWIRTQLDPEGAPADAGANPAAAASPAVTMVKPSSPTAGAGAYGAKTIFSRPGDLEQTLPAGRSALSRPDDLEQTVAVPRALQSPTPSALGSGIAGADRLGASGTSGIAALLSRSQPADGVAGPNFVQRPPRANGMPTPSSGAGTAPGVRPALLSGLQSSYQTGAQPGRFFGQPSSELTKP